MRRGNKVRPSTTTTFSDSSNSVAAAAAADGTTLDKPSEDKEEDEASTTQRGGIARNSTAADEEHSNMVLEQWDGVVPRAVKDIFKFAREGLSEAPAVAACEGPYRSTSSPGFGEPPAESRPPTVGSGTRTGWASTSRPTTGGSGSGLSSLDDTIPTIPNPEPSAASGTPGEATVSPQQAPKRQDSRGAQVSRRSDRPGIERGAAAQEGSEKRKHGETRCSVECSYMQVWCVARRTNDAQQCSLRNTRTPVYARCALR